VLWKAAHRKGKVREKESICTPVDGEREKEGPLFSDSVTGRPRS